MAQLFQKVKTMVFEDKLFSAFMAVGILYLIVLLALFIRC